MANSISDQAAKLATDSSQRALQISDLQNVKQEMSAAQMASTAAKHNQANFQRISQYNASGAAQMKQQGKQLCSQGQAKSMIGMGLMGMGFVMMAMAAIPMMGPAMLAKGMEMIGQGVGQLIMGKNDEKNGREMLAMAAEKLAKATENKILSVEEAKIAQKEMNRSKILEFKKQALEDLIQIMKPMLEKMGVNGEQLNEKQLSKWFDKMFEQGAKTLANGGILETDFKDVDGKSMFKDADGKPLEGNFYFTRDDQTGKFYQIEPARDSDGKVLTGDSGQPLLDTQRGMKEVVDGDLKTYLELQWKFVDLNKKLIGELGKLQSNGDDTSYVPYDINNLQDMIEYADLVSKTNLEGIKSGAIPAPLKLVQGPNGPALQKWDWEHNVPLDVPVSIDDIAGGSYDKGDIESYQNALSTSQNALRTLGLQAGGQLFNLNADVKFKGLSSVNSGTDNFSSSTSRDGDAFQSFLGKTSVSSALNRVRAQSDVLNSTASDLLPNGKA